MTQDLQAKFAALPEWPHGAQITQRPDEIAGWYKSNADAALARLALLREWVAEANHHDGCACLYYAASSEMWFASDDKPCTCGRDALLAATEVPK